MCYTLFFPVVKDNGLISLDSRVAGFILNFILVVVFFFFWLSCDPVWYSCLENFMDRRAWQATGYGNCRVGHD